ncbi:MAG: rhomboid family intramembrane serine protease [Prolixibacteraceae bacterium]|jgi:membrane associated rhomboid family serine protease|nr:rhomboid family intramembrane serine protease [Prolixibacteraceae bacterium]
MSKLSFRYYPQPVSPEMEQLEKKIFKYSLILPVFFLLIIWLIKIAEVVLGIRLTELGMYPRHIEGLLGIFTSPLIHGDFGHLINNSTSFLILSTALFFFYRKMAYLIFLLNYVLAGILLWIGGREVWHIGASGIIYGLAAFLLFAGILRKDVRLLTISLIVIFLYGSFFWGLFPIEEHISWDGHLMGAISGTILALVFYKYGPPRQKFEWEDETDDENEEDAPLPPEYQDNKTTPISKLN